MAASPWTSRSSRSLDVSIVIAAYIEAARRSHAGQFDVMDCCHLTYADGFFDHVVSIAATHHLDDSSLEATISEALRVCGPGGSLHVIDGILPVSGSA